MPLVVKHVMYLKCGWCRVDKLKNKYCGLYIIDINWMCTNFYWNTCANWRKISFQVNYKPGINPVQLPISSPNKLITHTNTNKKIVCSLQVIKMTPYYRASDEYHIILTILKSAFQVDLFQLQVIWRIILNNGWWSVISIIKIMSLDCRDFLNWLVNLLSININGLSRIGVGGVISGLNMLHDIESRFTYRW